MNKYSQIMCLLEQIMEKNIYYDNLSKAKYQTGDSWDIHHLKLLKILIEEYEKERNA